MLERFAVKSDCGKRTNSCWVLRWGFNLEFARLESIAIAKLVRLRSVSLCLSVQHYVIEDTIS